jgi:UDPglucose 6-dehydrogenase
VNIGFVGLGKLGFPVALAIGSRGHTVHGWDASPSVRADVEAGRVPHGERGAEELLHRSSLRLASVEELVRASEIVFVAVQTPHEPALEGAGRLPDHRSDFDYSYLVGAVRSVAEAAAEQRKSLTLAVISTGLPGTMEREVGPLLPAGITLAYNPLFTAMGTTIEDFLNPEFVLIGVGGAVPEDPLETSLGRFYRTLHDRPLFTTDLKTAELIKVAYNTFIGQKIVFANTMMEIAHKTGGNVDDLEAALGLASDRIVSPRYLRGGMGDGGPCHPRDNIALSWLSEQLTLSHDIFTDIMRAREHQAEWLADLIAERRDGLPVVVLGKAFKPDSHLTEGSPARLLAAILEERGIAFDHHDGHVDGPGAPVEERAPSLFFVATRHREYGEATFPPGSLVLDPWGFIPDQEGVTVVRIGRR